jgi:mono/diheme cytochrome c family protein
MNITRLNLTLAVLLLVAVFFATTIDVDRSRTNFEFLPQMKRSAASNAWSASTVFPNGRTMQAPVSGTIARGDLPLHYAATKEDAIRAGEELLNPFALDANTNATPEPNVSEVVSTPVDAAAADQVTATEAGSPRDAGLAGNSSGSHANPAVASTSAPGEPDAVARLDASVQRGAEVYSVFCVSCHGMSGAGDGPVAKRGFPPPPPLPTGKSVQMKDGQLFHILSHGQGSMAPMAAQLSRDRRWDVINFIRSLQKGVASTASTDLNVPAAPIVPLDAPVPAEETRP